MKQGDIILVPFPFTDLSSAKTRPALVVSIKPIEQDIILTAITSIAAKRSVKISNNNLSRGQLPLDSYVRYDKIVTLDKSLARKIVARVNEKTLKDVIVKIKGLF